MMTSTLTTSLKNRTQARTKVVIEEAHKSLSKRSFSLFTLAPDFHYAAAILVASRFTLADREELYTLLIEKNETVPAFKDKMRLLNLDVYYNNRLFRNGYLPGQEAERIENSRHIHYKVWLELVRRRRVLTNAEFIAIFPEA